MPKFIVYSVAILRSVISSTSLIAAKDLLVSVVCGLCDLFLIL